VLVTAAEARPFRSLSDLRVELPAGVSSLIGPNGAGKTNFLEALYFALTGRSFRTSDRRDLIPFGGQVARAEATIVDADGVERRFLAAVSRSEGRRHLLDGSAVEPTTAARHRPPVAVFSPDRLALIKGPPAERRAHLDRYLAARWPSRSDLRRRFGRALAQRNALLANLASGRGGGEIEAWDAAFADAASALAEARAEALAELSTLFTAAGADLGLEGEATLGYAPRAALGRDEILAGLEERRDADLRLGRSSWGPHLDEVKVALDGRALRRFGSQGQQRTALLALLFAEREALATSDRPTPLLLLDDVMSELDPGRRERLVARLEGPGQALITAADEESLPPAARSTAVRLSTAERGAIA
jgi:DNA replication and repair protein RecF